ncbi:MAG: glutathione S-transferase family protein [Halioglobus sp.]|jgi:glutathione S-transferase|nr:glutathione S-transferase family protein [Halioglobus sp.]
MKLWHCSSARSLRPLWTLEELELEYEVQILPFPPRVFERDYLKVNSLGTVPFFSDGDIEMTESVGICQYLIDHYQRYDFGLEPSHPEYGAYLNWLHHADATLTFPQTIAMRYYYLEPTPEKQAVADDYSKWYLSRLRRLDSHLESHEYLVDNRFTIADIAVSYALYLGRALKFDQHYKPQTAEYLQRLMERPAFKRADQQGEPLQFPDRE